MEVAGLIIYVQCSEKSGIFGINFAWDKEQDIRTNGCEIRVQKISVEDLIFSSENAILGQSSYRLS